MREKLWAYRRGFLSIKINQYGLNQENYMLYLSDFDYYKLFPINDKYRIWIDDKLTTKYILSPYNEYLPKYYCYIGSKGLIQSLVDGTNIKTIDGIIECLKIKKDLALKLDNGSLGEGFYKISCIKNQFYINNKMCEDEEKLKGFLKNLEGYLVTEYIEAHSDIRKISNFGLNTVRIMVINEHEKQPIIANSFMRFGTKRTGVVDNASAGGIFAIVDVGNGKYYDAKRIENKDILKCEKHPDTDMVIEGTLPNWDLIKSKLVEISSYISKVTYMRFDIAITEDGFRIIEINSHQDIKWYQYYYPLLKDNEATDFYKRLLQNR